MPKQFINPPNHHEPMGYSHAVKVGNTVYVAGQIAWDAPGNLVGPGDIEAQAVQVFENLKRVVEASGASLEDVVKTVVLITHPAYREAYRSVRSRYLKEPFPASTLAVIDSLAFPDLLIEIECVAVVE